MKGAGQGVARPTPRMMAFVPKVVATADLPKAAKESSRRSRKPKHFKDHSNAVSAAADDFDIADGPTLGLMRSGHLEINLPVLLRTRMLITASSGGGKSYAMRRLIEQTAPMVQQIIIDSEGEFETLTEKFPFAVFNNRSKVPLSECSAYALAQELIRKEISAIVDISEFGVAQRDHFLARFIQGLLKLEQEAWHPVMLFIDEIHLFAPQQGRAESKSHVGDLACRGRKRGICLVGATNRLSLLYKSVASELQNRLIGQTGLDVDIKRAADELGMGRAHAISTLTTLDPGGFMVFGPALSKVVQRVAIGPVQTTHGVPLGEIKGPATPTEEMMEEIFKRTEEPKKKPPDESGKAAGDAGKVEQLAQRREEARQHIAQQRLKILAPILALAEDSPDRGAAISRAVEQSGLNRQTLYNWLSGYDPADPLGSLAPVRVPRNWQPEAVPEKKPRAPRKKVIRLRK